MSKKQMICASFLILTGVLSFLGWTNLRQFLFNDSDGTKIFLMAGIFLLVMAIFAIAVLIFNSWKILLSAGGLILLSYVLIFGYHWAYLAVFLVGLGLVSTGIVETKKEKAVHIKILPAQIAKPAIKSLFTVLAIAVSVVIYFSPPAQGFGTEIKIPRSLFDLVIDSMSGFLQGQIEGQLKSSVPVTLSIPGIPPITISDVSQAIGGSGVNMDEILDQKTKDALYQTTNEQTNFFFKPYKRYLPYGLAVAVFFSLKAIGFIFVLFSGLIARLIFLILKTLKVVNVGKEMVERETIEV